MVNVPVALLIFNRPDTTERVFAAIRQAQPAQLFVIADGPRPDRAGEGDKCAATRAIIERIDWKCQVFKNYSNVNLGCAKRVSSGLSWVFEQVESAIVLEDDCLPHPTFFRFCEELLERYREDSRVTAICGQNIQFGRQRTAYSYYFSRYNPCWGWASWRRAWQHYDLNLKLWSEIRSAGVLEDILVDPKAVQYWTKIFQTIHDGHIKTWDYQWQFACWLQNGSSIIPSVNLISNIGFGPEATHTVATSADSLYAEMPTEALTFPLRHPPFLIPHRRADNFIQNTAFDPTLLVRAKNKIQKIPHKLRHAQSARIDRQQQWKISD